MSGDKPLKRAGKRPGRKPSKMDVKAKLERSRQSARECRARKKLRYQYLEELVTNREKAIFALREELEMSKRMCMQIDKGVIPQAIVKLLAARAYPPQNRLPSGQVPHGFRGNPTLTEGSGGARFLASSSASRLPSAFQSYPPSPYRAQFSGSQQPVARYSVQAQPHVYSSSADGARVARMQPDRVRMSSQSGFSSTMGDYLQSVGALGSQQGHPQYSAGGAAWMEDSPASTGTLHSAGSSSNLSSASWTSGVSESGGVTSLTSVQSSQGFHSYTTPTAFVGNSAQMNPSSGDAFATSHTSGSTGNSELDSILNYLTSDAPPSMADQGGGSSSSVNSLQFEPLQPRGSASASVQRRTLRAGFYSSSTDATSPSGLFMQTQAPLQPDAMDQSLISALQDAQACPSDDISTAQSMSASACPGYSRSSGVDTQGQDRRVSSWISCHEELEPRISSDYPGSSQPMLLTSAIPQSVLETMEASDSSD